MIYITSYSAWLVALVGLGFFFVNLVQGWSGLAYINGFSSAVGFLSLLLLRFRLALAASLLLMSGVSILFTFSALWFRNGMEYALLVTMLGSVFIFDTKLPRFLLAAMGAAGFLLVKIDQFDASLGTGFPMGRYVANLVFFLGGYYAAQEILRSVYANYHLRLKQANLDLMESRRQLDEKHARLMARTEELDVANTAKAKLFSIIAHDLRGPVLGLKSVLDMLRDGDLGPEEFKELLPDLATDVGHAHECLDTLLTWSAGQLGMIKSTPVKASPRLSAESCTGLLGVFASRKGIALRNEIPAEASVFADENQLLAIFRNLIANAIKFTPAGGTIRLHAKKAGAFWDIAVADSGVGMSAATVAQLFTTQVPSSSRGTANEQGLGLGLTICREFVEKNGGKIFVESEIGRGSSFHFTLPAA